MDTERLILRPYAEDDADRVLDIHSRFEVIRWLGDPPFTPMADREEALAWIANWRAVAEGGPYDGAYAIEVKDTAVVAGSVMVTPIPGDGDGKRQIGWHLHPDSVGHGYATEAARALLDHVFAAGLEEIWCDMHATNASSAAVAERLGLRSLGVMDDPWYAGEGRIFHATRQEWLARERD